MFFQFFHEVIKNVNVNEVDISFVRAHSQRKAQSKTFYYPKYSILWSREKAIKIQKARFTYRKKAQETSRPRNCWETCREGPLMHRSCGL